MSNYRTQYSAKKLDKFKMIIEDKLSLTVKELANLENDQATQKQYTANSNVDFNQNSKHFQQQAKKDEFIRNTRNKVLELKAALKRIENNTYGICDRTGELIREERLMANPIARFDLLSE